MCSDIRHQLSLIDQADPGYGFADKFDIIQYLRLNPPTHNRTLKPHQFRVYVASFPNITPQEVDSLCHDVEHGVLLGIDLAHPPHDLSQKAAHWTTNLKQAAFILDKFIKELQKAILVEAPQRPLYFINFFAVPKKGVDGLMSMLRLIRNGSWSTSDSFCINDFIAFEAYTIKNMPNLRRYARLLHRRQFMAMRDLKDAFRQLLLHASDHKFQGYSVFGQHFIDRHVAYGISSSAAACQRFVNLICAIFDNVFITDRFRNKRNIDISHCLHQIVAYIDDFLLVADDKKTICEMERRFDLLLRSLGVDQSPHKAEHCCREGVVHGWHWDLIKQQVSIPSHKYETLRYNLLCAITHRVITIGALQKLVGRIMHYSQISPLAKLFAWHTLQWLKKYVGGRSKSRTKRRPVMIGNSIVRSFIFWYHLAPYLRSATIESIAESPTITIFGSSDASSLGAGFLIGARWGYYRFQGRAQDYHITLKEAHVICVMLRDCAPFLSGHKIGLYVDNLPLVCAFSNRWSRSPALMQMIWELMFVCEKYRVYLHLEWIPSEQNDISDALSRNDLPRFYNIIHNNRFYIEPVPVSIDPIYSFLFPLYSNVSDSAEFVNFKSWLYTHPNQRRPRWWMPSLMHLLPTVPSPF